MGGTSASPLPSPAVELQAVLDAELAYLHHNRHDSEPNPDIVRRSLIGLALSGGGIRSATTNLGILQALASMRILPMVDYLSTVSGGGYIGACFSTLLSWNNNAVLTAADPRAAFTFSEHEPPAFSTEAEDFPFRADRARHDRDDASPAERVSAEGDVVPERVHPRAGNDILAHLRTHGNFLIAHRGLFRRDALRGIGALTVGMVYNAGAFLFTLFTASALYLAGVLAVAPALPNALGWPRPTASVSDTIRSPLIAGDSAILRTRQAAATCAAGDTDCRTEIETALRPPSVVDAIARNARTVGVVFASTTRGWTGTGGIANRVRGMPAPLKPIILALLLGAIAAIGLLTWMRARLDDYLRGRIAAPNLAPGDSVEEAFERSVLQRCATTVVATTALAVIGGQVLWRADIPGAGQVVWLLVPFATLAGAVIVAFVTLAVFLPLGNSWTRRSRSLNSAFYAVVSWGFYIMLALAIAPLIIFAMRDHPLGAGLGAIGSLVATRLLATRAPGSGKKFTLSPGMLRLVLGIAVFLLIVLGTLFFAAVVAKYTDTSRGAGIAGGAGLILLVILGRLVDHNKLGPQFFYRDRLAETYLFSELPDAEGRLRVFRDAMEMPLDALHGGTRPRKGDEQSTWRNTAPYHLISAAINLAGSRDLTRKDRKSGYWLFSKLFCGSTHTGFRRTSEYRGGRTKVATAVSISGAAASSAIGRDTFFAQAFATVLFNIRLGSWLENPAHETSVRGTERRVFWPSYLIREVGMNTTESARLVNLSDGGHTGDNLGIYPLLQRRCKVIIACDAERDPRLSFGSFTEALRHAYIDMGVDIDIDLTMIRADPATGLSRSHCAVGRIHYPDRPDQESFLIYIKNSLVGDEPEPVLNYRVTCPDFPHETTADQFFDDAQFESYRALGHHMAEHTFGPWLRDAAFANARDHYSPTARANA